ncbi:hypothetical protein [Nostoc sp.]|uniref:hypothetical protein n=1 Tax=Nostoc sp. TaxID=1180 RepID=UPI002FF5D5C1
MSNTTEIPDLAWNLFKSFWHFCDRANVFAFCMRSQELYRSLLQELRQNQVAQFFESEAKENDSLEQVIELVNEWMAEESGYDEETYPQIETALTQNRLSV